MAAEPDRRRGRSDEEDGGKKMKKRRLEDTTGSEQELELHAVDEDMFSLSALIEGRGEGKRERAVLEIEEFRIMYTLS